MHALCHLEYTATSDQALSSSIIVLVPITTEVMTSHGRRVSVSSSVSGSLPPTTTSFVKPVPIHTYPQMSLLPSPTTLAPRSNLQTIGIDELVPSHLSLAFMSTAAEIFDARTMIHESIMTIRSRQASSGVHLSSVITYGTPLQSPPLPTATAMLTTWASGQSHITAVHSSVTGMSDQTSKVASFPSSVVQSSLPYHAPLQSPPFPTVTAILTTWFSGHSHITAIHSSVTGMSDQTSKVPSVPSSVVQSSLPYHAPLQSPPFPTVAAILTTWFSGHSHITAIHSSVTGMSDQTSKVPSVPSSVVQSSLLYHAPLQSPPFPTVTAILTTWFSGHSHITAIHSSVTGMSDQTSKVPSVPSSVVQSSLPYLAPLQSPPLPTVTAILTTWASGHSHITAVHSSVTGMSDQTSKIPSFPSSVVLLPTTVVYSIRPVSAYHQTPLPSSKAFISTAAVAKDRLNSTVPSAVSAVWPKLASGLSRIPDVSLSVPPPSSTPGSGKVSLMIYSNEVDHLCIGTEGKISTAAIAGGATGASIMVILLILLIVLCYYVRYKRKSGEIAFARLLLMSL